MKVVFVVGCTASGKSDWALKWAQAYGGVIVNCDSIQVYKNLEIGSAKPSLEERELCPHYLFDYVNPPDVITAGVYRRSFFEVLKNINESTNEDVPVFVVGGTGFYFQAIEHGMHEVPKVSPEFKEKIEAELNQVGGIEKLYQEILDKDPKAAAGIKPQDSYRIARAIEILRSVTDPNQNISTLKEHFEKTKEAFPYPLLKVGLAWDRKLLRERIQTRTELMIKKGLIEEVISLKQKGLLDWGPLESVGYREVVEYLDTDQTKEWLIEQIVTHTYQLAKRQRTWFQKDEQINWFSGLDGSGPASNLVEEFLRR